MSSDERRVSFNQKRDYLDKCHPELKQITAKADEVERFANDLIKWSSGSGLYLSLDAPRALQRYADEIRSRRENRLTELALIASNKNSVKDETS